MLFIVYFPFFSGDPFVARYLSNYNYVDDNKREAATIFMNHLIDLGVVTLNGRRGPDFQAYVERLDAGRWGHYTLHNARCLVKRHLGARNFVFSPTGEEGRYNCSLQYPRYGRGNRILKIKKKVFFISLDRIPVDKTETKKRDTRNLAFFEFANQLYAAGIIPAARN